MSIKKIVSMACVALALSSLSAYAEDAAIKPVAPMGGEVMPSISLVFGKPMSLAGCAGVCSAGQGFDMDVRWMKSTWFDLPENSFELHTSAGVRYSSYSLTVNGNASQFDSEAVSVGFHVRHRELPRLELALRADVFGMAILRSDTAPRQIDFASAGDIGLSYEVTPAFQVSLGLANRTIPSQKVNSLMLNTVNLGFSWTPKRK
jgi:hypothetical protein